MGSGLTSWLKGFLAPGGVGVLVLCSLLILVIAHFVPARSLAAVLGFFVGLGLMWYVRRRRPPEVISLHHGAMPLGTVDSGEPVALTVVVAVTGPDRFKPTLRYAPGLMPPVEAAAMLKVLAYQIEADGRRRTAGRN